MTALRHGARPGAAKVELSDARGDSIQAGQARVRLKLGAIAYASAQVGLDVDAKLARVALGALIEAGIRYWEAVTGKRFTAKVDFTRADELRVAALAYVNARHGVDANIEIARAGMGVLCEASINYCQDLQQEDR